jgi:chorismate mutase
VSGENDQRLWAVRGAVRVGANEREPILAATRDLVGELLERNSLRPEQIVSVIFTCTDDLNAEFPAVAARELGLSGVPLICTRELDVPGAMSRVIRVLMHFYAPSGHDPAHAYLGDAQELRADLHGAQ